MKKPKPNWTAIDDVLLMGNVIVGLSVLTFLVIFYILPLGL